MENKKAKDKTLKLQGTRKSRNRERTLNTSLFDRDSFSDYPWWGRLLIKIILPHKNKFIDKAIDIGCLLMIIAVGCIILFVAMQIFNLLQKVIC